MDTRPNVIILAGPNGAGKSTISPIVFPVELGVIHYVNADTIARGLSAFHSEDMALEAGRIMLRHLHTLADQRVNFGFETTLATKSFAPWIEELKRNGYLFRLFFLWLPSADMAVERVRDRVKQGGHHVPEETVRRRYRRGLSNFFRLYQPLADLWKVYNNAVAGNPVLVAEGTGTIETVREPTAWGQIKQGVAHD